MNRQNPFTEIERMFDQLSNQFGEFEPGTEMGGSIAIDVADTGDAFEVTADVPSFESDDIQVTLPDAQTVRIDASRTSETETETDEQDRHYIRRERQEQSLSRTIPLPDDVAEADATADFDNGMLTIHLPKVERSDSTNIPLS
ncbi:Hsp20/alpha crystallin family protein [Halorientalis brevis]|uniref:Hsp20/alpha crystallin family protein n=1 Tax=Halorientalis brevis TaxID=1126241 RepID=A0ABD6C8U2_9EURY|nr:Hsp20/alpha crystallin family protein [Halorientalis brevis]